MTDPQGDLTRAVELLAVGAGTPDVANRYAVCLTVAQCVAVLAERDRLAAQVQRVEAWAADRIGTAIGRPYAVEVRAALNGSDGWAGSLTGRVDGEAPS